MAYEVFANVVMPGQKGALELSALRAWEQISRPFRYELDFACEGLAVAECVGMTANVALEDTHGQTRYLDGVVRDVRVLANDRGDQRCRVTLIPRPYLIHLNYGCRIFQDLTVPDIVKKVFKDAKVEDEYFTWDLKKTHYSKREYCCQYNESEWDFVCRLLEEEGIYFSFQHTATGHKMEIADSSNLAPMLSPSQLQFEIDPAFAVQDVMAWDWAAQSRVSVTKVTLNDYDMQAPNPWDRLITDPPAQASGDLIEREWYEYPGLFPRLADPGGTPESTTAGKLDPADSARIAKIRLEELRSSRKSATTATNMIGVTPGRRFELQGHPTANGEYVVVGTSYAFNFDRLEGDLPLTVPGDIGYDLQISVVPKDQIYRPARTTARPTIVGCQTAIVTGPAGEEIYCDHHGRVKLQFHWDREGKLDEKTSAWIRTSQAHTTGSCTIPRIGWEVLVEFEDGDPDRPLCMGRLFNPAFPPNESLPASKTVTVHRSASTPGSAGALEVRMDDIAGNQALSINSCYDINVKTANNRVTKVAVSSNKSVGVNRTASVGGKETIAVKGGYTQTVGGTHDVDVSGNRTLKIDGSLTEEVTGAVSLTAGTEMMQIGNPIAAVLEVVAAAAIQAAAGVAAQGASRGAAALLGPIAPALGAAQAALGPVAQMAGPAATLLGGGNPTVNMLGAMAGGLSSAPGAQGAAAVATGMAAAAASGALASAAAGAIRGGAGGGAGGGGGGGGGGGSGGASGSGSGAWSVTVGGNVTETIGPLAAINSAASVGFDVKASKTESISAARVELIRGGKMEMTGTVKSEKVGIYFVNVSEAIQISAGAIAYTMAKQTQKITGGHGMSAKSGAGLAVKTILFDGSSSVSLKCGSAEIVVDSGGISIKGNNTTIEAKSKLETTKAEIGP